MSIDVTGKKTSVAEAEVRTVSRASRSGIYPFNAEQTLNIVSEIGPLFTMFVVNFVWGVEYGVWALIGMTLLSLVVSLIVLHRPPVMPFIAGAVSVIFGGLTLYTNDPNWVQIKVTIFNALVALILYVGLLRKRYFFEFVFGKTFQYTTKGWRKLTRNAAHFFLVTAIANEAVRQGFADVTISCPHQWYWLLRKPFLSGLDIWMIFKLFLVMPLTGLFFVWQARMLRRYQLLAPIRTSEGEASGAHQKLEQS
jgi:intracellular septation protein